MLASEHESHPEEREASQDTGESAVHGRGASHAVTEPAIHWHCSRTDGDLSSGAS